MASTRHTDRPSIPRRHVKNYKNSFKLYKYDEKMILDNVHYLHRKYGTTEFFILLIQTKKDGIDSYNKIKDPDFPHSYRLNNNINVEVNVTKYDEVADFMLEA